MTPTEIDFLINGFNNMYTIFSKAVSELKSGSEQLVYRTEGEAYKKTGLQRTYWDRIKYRVPYMEIPAEHEGGEQRRVYPVKALEEFIEKNTVYPEGK